LARELHDELGQLLNVINLDLETAKQVCGPAAPQLDENIRRVHRAIEQVRNLTFDLRPPMLDELGLVATLRWYADRHLQSAGLVLHFDSEAVGNHLPFDLATTCYRVVQEALTNVIRHAHARQVWIEFREAANEVHLSIRDDGVGFNSDLVRQRLGSDAGFGVLGMQERVEILGGKFEIHSDSSQGTRIHVQIPLTAADLPSDVVKGVAENEFHSGLTG
jgi:signal transduction histidine kinase